MVVASKSGNSNADGRSPEGASLALLVADQILIDGCGDQCLDPLCDEVKVNAHIDYIISEWVMQVTVP